jgi:hypothetical protein
MDFLEKSALIFVSDKRREAWVASIMARKFCLRITTPWGSWSSVRPTLGRRNGRRGIFRHTTDASGPIG